MPSYDESDDEGWLEEPVVLEPKPERQVELKPKEQMGNKRKVSADCMRRRKQVKP